MKLSIITINLNNCEGLKKTIESVVAQTFNDYEWIVIDGGSTDGSRELIEQNSGCFAYWVSEPDNGIYNAINKGIAQAKGDFIQILNSGDCLFEPSTLEKVFAHDLTGDINYGDAMLVYHPSWDAGALACGNMLDKKYPDTVSLNYFKHDVINHQATFFRREVFDEHPYNEDYLIASDWAYCFEAVCRGQRFVHIPQTIVYYDNGGISAQWTERQIKEREEILEKYIPAQLKPDMDVLDELHTLRIRKSTRKLLDFSLKFCKRWDKLMKNIEKHRKN